MSSLSVSLEGRIVLNRDKTWFSFLPKHCAALVTSQAGVTIQVSKAMDYLFAISLVRRHFFFFFIFFFFFRVHRVMKNISSV